MNEFIVCDVCSGVGNLENQFGTEFKQHCYLSTLEENDVEICKIKGFENVIQYDYLKNAEQPKWKHQGVMRDINEICQIENKKLMIIINPPYKRKTGFKNDLAIEFFNKIIKLSPQVIVFYYKTESFLRDEIEHYIKSEYKIVSHIMSNAKKTFLVSEWPISQVIFDKDKGEEIDKSKIAIDRYELNSKTDEFKFIKTYTYNQSKPNLIKEIEKEIKNNQSGLVLGRWFYLQDVISIGNGEKESSNKITTNNLKYTMLSKGINFNTHDKYFERNDYCYRGTIKKIPKELFNDAIMFSMFYVRFWFTNKEKSNYIMPFTSSELGCTKNDLNVGNGGKESKNKITTNNLKYAMLSKGINFNTDDKYFERNDYCYRGNVNQIPQELFNDSIMFSMFYIKFWFTNKEKSNYIMPFTSSELGCNKNDLNVGRREDGIYNADSESFDFREWLKQFEFSEEAKNLYKAALQVFLYYHKTYQNTNYNDSFYDITNTIMGKDPSMFKSIENDTRIEKVKTTKGTTGFGRNTVKSVVGSKDLPIFYDFFDARDILARKINKQLVENNLLLWKRENIY